MTGLVIKGSTRSLDNGSCMDLSGLTCNPKGGYVFLELQVVALGFRLWAIRPLKRGISWTYTAL